MGAKELTSNNQCCHGIDIRLRTLISMSTVTMAVHGLPGDIGNKCMLWDRHDEAKNGAKVLACVQFI